MKKLLSLIRACMTSDMNIFKFKKKKDKKKTSLLFPILLGAFLMLGIGFEWTMLFEQTASVHGQNAVIALVIAIATLVTLIEGIYKSSSLLFNCSDDQLLLSLPIKRSTVLFIRMFKFYVFELLFNSILIVPLIVSYLFFAESITWTFYLVAIVMLFTLPVIPIVLSCIIGSITASISSRFKYKNLVQIVVSIIFAIVVLLFSFQEQGFMDSLAANINNIYNMLSKIYYPAVLLGDLCVNFNAISFIIYIVATVVIYVLTIYVLSLFYFKINSKLKKRSSSNNINIKDMNLKSKSVYASFIKKELNKFFNTPVFVVNAGFGLVVYILLIIVSCIKFDGILTALGEQAITLFDNYKNMSIVLLVLIVVTSFTTSITSSVISLEGRNINILKSLPIPTKTILLAKALACSVLTTPVMVLGIIIFSIKFKVSIIEFIILLLLSFIVPLISHFIGLIINLHYPKLDSDNSAEVVKQSTSSAVSVLLGVVLLSISSSLIIAGLIFTNSIIVLVLSLIMFGSIDLLLYSYINNKGVKLFNNLSI